MASKFSILSHLVPLSYILSAVLGSPESRSGTDVRLNHVQVIGTHNTYHIEASFAERTILENYMGVNSARNLYYSHPSLTDQLQYQNVRGFELDIFVDNEGGKFSTPLIRQLSNLPYPSSPDWQKPGTKVLHVADMDIGTICVTFVGCLKEIRAWSKANKGHTLIPIMLEFKTTDGAIEAIGGVKSERWDATNLETVDAEIRSVFNSSELITPDDVRKKGLTLEQSILRHGWPSQKDGRDKVMFLMDNEPNADSPRTAYIAGHSNLEKRPIFTNSIVGQPDAAFLKRNDPMGDNTKLIQDLVKKGYFVRTRSDVPIGTVLANDFTMLEAALSSGAQLVSTDFPSVGMASRYNSSFVARFPEGGSVRCNPVIGGKKCKSKDLEKLS